MLEILLYNIVFWSVYIYLCSLPEKMVQSMIDTIPSENFFEKSEKSA